MIHTHSIHNLGNALCLTEENEIKEMVKKYHYAVICGSPIDVLNKLYCDYLKKVSHKREDYIYNLKTFFIEPFPHQLNSQTFEPIVYVQKMVYHEWLYSMSKEFIVKTRSRHLRYDLIKYCEEKYHNFLDSCSIFSLKSHSLSPKKYL